MNERAARYIGLCAASRSLACGSNAVLDAVRGKKAALVLLASDTSVRTAKQISDKCAFHDARLILPGCSMEELAAAAGKKSELAVCAVTNGGLAEAIIKELQK